MSANGLALIYTYNKFLVELLVLLKKADGTGGVKRILKGKYRAIDPTSDKLMRHAARTFPCARLASAQDTWSSLMQDRTFTESELLPGIQLGALVTTDAAREGAASFMYLLALLALTYGDRDDRQEDQDAEADDLLARQVLDAVSRVQSAPPEGAQVEDWGSAPNGDLAQVLDCIVDEDVRELLLRFRRTVAAASAAASAPAGDDAWLTALDNTKFADMAKEIASEIDFTKLDMSEMMDLSKIGDPSSALGSIVSKMGVKVKAQMDSGELNADDFVASALKVLGSGGAGGAGAGGLPGLAGLGNLSGLLNNPLVAQAMRSFTAGGGGFGGLGGPGLQDPTEPLPLPQPRASVPGMASESTMARLRAKQAAKHQDGGGA